MVSPCIQSCPATPWCKVSLVFCTDSRLAWSVHRCWQKCRSNRHSHCILFSRVDSEVKGYGSKIANAAKQTAVKHLECMWSNCVCSQQQCASLPPCTANTQCMTGARLGHNQQRQQQGYAARSTEQQHTAVCNLVQGMQQPDNMSASVLLECRNFHLSINCNLPVCQHSSCCPAMSAQQACMP